MSDSKNIEVGKKAPAFHQHTDEGSKLRLTEFKGEKNVVLYFYPKDSTPGCTQEACDFQENMIKFKKQDAVVIGVSPDSVKSHLKFKEKYDLNFLLISDESKEVCEKYGVWVEKNMYGRKYMGVERATFLIDKQGKVAAIWPKVKVKGHIDEVYEKLKELNKAQK